MKLNILKHPPLVLICGFLVFIILGALILKLPGFTYHDFPLLKLLFTTTSAVTVTGLSVIDTAQFTIAGQVVLMILMEAGGLGFMTFAVLALMALQRRLGMGSQIIASQAMGGIKLSEVTEATNAIVKLALVTQSTGFVLLTVIWLPDIGLAKATYQALFYTISAFNNAGFALTSDNLVAFQHQPLTLLVISTLIIVGGLGFFVVADFVKSPFARELKVNTKLILTVTLGLNIFSFLLIWQLERSNVNTISLMPLKEQLANTWFAAITPRTAGFNSLPMENFTDASTFLTIVLMFIGGGSFSTAGGIKLGTLIVLLLTTYAFMRQRDTVAVHRRRIPDRLVKKSIAATVVTALMITFSVFVLLTIEKHHEFLDVLFEVVSAMSTVGLSRGITNLLTPTGEIVLMFIMFAGRIGPLTVTYLFALPKSTKIQYPETIIDVG